ncbi:MAG: serine/threonine-protein kinase [Planktothrix sp.]|uniref:serine/threonine-protein kinase n=1 Tax=Planktothrix sp. TaxID=3088171 RepID=UPI0038D4E27A
MSSRQIHHPEDCINNRYKIINFIGEGGMQQVYYAEDLALKRKVALKVPKNMSAEKRFKRSAVVSARVNHPNVAKTLDYLEDGGNLYLIEEFISGQDLKEGVIQKLQVVDPYLTAKIFHYLAKGIAASHRAGVIHRDLKPSNIMVSGSFNLTEIKITDFGIAKMAEEEISNAVEGGESSMSNSSTVLGALPYMAPEMIQPPQNADKPSDIWSLGAMMYELISGEKPFGVGLITVQNILNAAPPPKPTHLDDKIQFQPLGTQLYELILLCLKKNREERPTADELVQKCEKLCYPVVDRKEGIVDEYSQWDWGFIKSNDGRKIFFHLDSVYGETPPIGRKVCFSEFPGSPCKRAHPVVLMQ